MSSAKKMPLKSLLRVGSSFRGDLLVGPTSVQHATFSCLQGDAQITALNRGPVDWTYAENFIHIVKSDGKNPEDVLADWKTINDPRMSAWSPLLRTFNELTIVQT